MGGNLVIREAEPPTVTGGPREFTHKASFLFIDLGKHKGRKRMGKPWIKVRKFSPAVSLLVVHLCFPLDPSTIALQFYPLIVSFIDNDQTAFLILFFLNLIFIINILLLRAHIRLENISLSGYEYSDLSDLNVL